MRPAGKRDALFRLAHGLVFAALCASLLSGCVRHGRTASAAPPGAHCLAGHYHGSATEIAAELILHESGRFRYALIYGALDERAEGQWAPKQGRIILDSDPVIAPQIVLLGEKHSGEGGIRVDLDVPQGISREYFDAELGFADGKGSAYQFGADGLTLDLEDGEEPGHIRITLPLFGVASPWRELSNDEGARLHYRFEPNDLGMVAFERFVLPREQNAVILQRHGRTLRLLHEGLDCQPF